MKKEYALGYFLELRHIEGAFKLLKKQIEEVSPLYNTLDFKIFREEKLIENFNLEEFYTRYVENDVFYYFQNEIFIINYLGVVSSYKIRNFHFLSFKALILYYSIGLYLHEVLNQYQTDFDEILKESNGKVYYGGKLNHIDPSNSNIKYYEDYRDFLSEKERLTKPEINKTKHVVTVDIKSFFYTINHRILLSIIDKNATEVTKKALRYDENTIASIEFYFKFLMKGSLGIPVSSQNLVSSFLSSIYFSPFDQYLIDEYLNKTQINYIRYVDDFYLIYELESTVAPSEARNLIYDLENDVSDFLSNELALSLSSEKGRRTKIDDLKSYNKFIVESSLPSLSELEIDFEHLQVKNLVKDNLTKSKSVEQNFNESIQIIETVKSQLKGFDKLNIETKEANFLNNILIDHQVREYCKSKPALDQINSKALFVSYDSLDFVLVKIKVFIHLISLNKVSREYLHDLIILENEDIKNINQKLSIIEKFILQLEFLSGKDPQEKILKKQELEKYRKDYILLTKKIIIEQPKNLHALLVLKMLDKSTSLMNFKAKYNILMLNMPENTSLMQQVKQRHLNERLDLFNVAFNHLLNEFQNLVESAYFNREKQDAKDIRNKLIGEKFKVREILLVSDFFKRRNQNSISHSNDPELGFWGVSKKEYLQYKNKIEPLVQKILNRIDQEEVDRKDVIARVMANLKFFLENKIVPDSKEGVH